MRSPDGATTRRDALLFHSIEGFLEQCEVSRLAELFARVVDPFFFERVFGGAIGLEENSERSREWELREFVGC